MSGRSLLAPVAGLFFLFAAWGVPLAAQDNLDADVPADSQLAGTVRTPDGTAVPGATLRVLQTTTGKAWITWTDENGTFEFPALPAGHFRAEVSQLGFVPATREIDLAPGVKTPADLKLSVGTLAAITAPPAAESAANVAPNRPASTESTNPPASGGPGAGGGSTAAANSAMPASNGVAASSSGGTNEGRGPGQGGNERIGPAGAAGQGGGRRAFQQLGLNGQTPSSAEGGTEEQSVAQAGGQLGQAASADAVQMIGTVAMGQSPAGGFPQPGEGGPGGPDTQMAFANGGNGIPGQGAPGGFGGPSGRAGPGEFGGGGGGQRGRGPQGGPQGVGPLWGAQRVARQRINRIHFNIYDTFGSSALNARPYSLYEANPPKISGWNEQAGFSLGGPLKIPHVYNGTDKTFFFINFGGTWQR
ncbi:MAG TPA: carboxypeptidase-like regulatory domain-containing protein, partial [Candidatus Acidoferrales bacterium]|nr:carboxypeptidase-like regulatory domain-containing protein [Candidatus Acidoferrales bacterium]